MGRLSPRRRLLTWRTLPRTARVEFLRAWWRLPLAMVLLRISPFRSVAPRIGSVVAPDSPAPALSDVRRAREIGDAVRRAARYAPWSARCLPQAMVASWLLGRAGIACVVRFGIRTGSEAVGDGFLDAAHAWVESGDLVVVGGRSSLRGYTPVAAFLSEPATRAGSDRVHEAE
ncbi:MAG: lasso peptide biosynthesis B2 protein [Gammaproteobacteria bacterium]